MSERIYIIDLSEPDPHLNPRLTLNDAREARDKYNSRSRMFKIKIWRVETDGSVTAVE